MVVGSCEERVIATGNDGWLFIHAVAQITCNIHVCLGLGLGAGCSDVLLRGREVYGVGLCPSS